MCFILRKVQKPADGYTASVIYENKDGSIKRLVVCSTLFYHCFIKGSTLVYVCPKGYTLKYSVGTGGEMYLQPRMN